MHEIPINYEHRIDVYHNDDVDIEVREWLAVHAGKYEVDWNTTPCHYKKHLSGFCYVEVPAMAVAIKDPEVSLLFRMVFGDKMV